MRKKYMLLLLLGLQGLGACREEKQEPDLTQALVGHYKGGYSYGVWYGWGLTQPPESRQCQPQLFKVDDNTIAIEVTLSNQPLVLQADVFRENQVYRLVVQTTQLPDRTVSGVAKPDQPNYHGTFDPASNGLKLNVVETIQAKDYLAEMYISKQ